eukprot:SAG11_NODE_771_length_7253_cov_2.635741_7_plen_62_part_00
MWGGAAWHDNKLVAMILLPLPLAQIVENVFARVRKPPNARFSWSFTSPSVAPATLRLWSSC